MTQIMLDNVSFGYSTTLFENVNLTITENDRIGIVGDNGTGKSTLMQCIAGLIEPSAGRIVCPKGTRFGFIEQDVPDSLKDMSLYEVISAVIPKADRDINSWKVDVALDVFKAPENIRQRPIKELSGGWQRLALIARTGISEPDVLLLDEPTNHLDVAKILVLEQWLNEQVRGIPLVVVSHDRNFLANCTEKTVFVRGTKVRKYDYSYAIARDLLSEDDRAAASQREKEEKEINRLKRSAHELRQVGVNNYSDAALKKSVQIAKRAELIETDLTQVHVESKRDIKLGNSGIQAKRVLGIKNVTIKTPDGTPLFLIEQLDIAQGERVVILGPNGSGKTQLLQHLYRAFKDIEKAKAEGISITPSAKLGFMDQHLAHLPLQAELRDYVSREFSLDNQRTTTALINAGFPVLSHKTKIGKLSHGQRARVALLGLHLTSPNFYIMDEPTNHLDIAGQEQLENEIIEHGASSILVSHDRKFVENVGTKFYVINKGKLIPIDTPNMYYGALLEAQDIETAGRNINFKKGLSAPKL